jgi:Flp pilus assembly protein TadG
MRRLRRSPERGVTAVVVALVMVVLCGFAAVAVDLGALWWDRKELQNGADAGAIAIAQACAKGACGSTATDANNFALRNKLDANATGVVTSLTGNSVTVETTSVRQLWFAPVLELLFPPGTLDLSKKTVTARATATWDATLSGLTTVPLTVSYCQFFWQNGFYNGFPTAGTPIYIQLMTQSKDFPTSSGTFPCADSNAAHNEVGGGFGWTQTTGTCSTTFTVGGWVSNDPGNSMPSSCSPALLQSILGSTPGKIVLVPLFDATNGLSGVNAKYQITGFAALKVGGYCFMPNPEMSPQGPCNANSQHIWGTFVSYSAIDPTSVGGTPIFYGVNSVKLTG